MARNIRTARNERLRKSLLAIINDIKPGTIILTHDLSKSLSSRRCNVDVRTLGSILREYTEKVRHVSDGKWVRL